MAGEIIRPKDLTPRPSPVASELMVVDNSVNVGAATIKAIVEAGRPAASQAEAVAGTDAAKAMTPLTTKQSIASEVGVSLASKAQGDLANTAVQPGSLATVATSGAYADLSGKPALGTAAATDASAYASAAQGGKADTAVQSIVAGANTSVDSTDPRNPVVSSTGGVTDGDKGDVVVSGSGSVWEVPRLEVFAEDFGAVGDNATNCTAAVWAAITSLRRNPKDNIDTIGGNVITMYSSGRVNFGPGVFRIDKDTLDITQDMGLTFVGAGSRGMTNALRGATTLLVTGTGAGFGIRAWRGGARSLAFRDMDICYESNLFTGDLIDCMSAPYLSLRDCYVGTFGNSGGTRHQSALSLIRSSYDEGMVVDRCVLDGAQRGVWLDDTRTDLGNTGFGGWGTKLKDTIFYDFSEVHLLQTNMGTRSRSGLALENVNFNPINVSPGRCLVLDILRGFTMRACSLVSSVSSAPQHEWVEIKDVVGTVADNRFGSLANGLTINGLSAVTVEGNNFETEGLNHGLRIRGGAVSSRNNRYESASNAILVQDDGVNVVRLDGGGDLFRSNVGSSINIVSSTTRTSGKYDYDSALDASASKFSNAAENMKIANSEGQILAVPGAALTITKYESGKEIRATGGVDQVFTMAAPVRGTRFTIFKPSSAKLTILVPGGNGFYTGTGSPKTKIEIAASDRGATIELVSYETAGWRVRYTGVVTLT